MFVVYKWYFNGNQNTALTSPIYIEQEATIVIPTTKQVIALHQEEEGEMQNLGQKSRMQGIISSPIYNLFATINWSTWVNTYFLFSCRYYSNGNYYSGSSSTYYCNNDYDCTGNLKCCYQYGKRQCSYPHYNYHGHTTGGIGIGL